MGILAASVILSLLQFVAAAQRPEIISFTPDGMLTWSNGIAGGYYSVESTPDLNFSWLPVTSDTWSQASSTAVASCSLDMTMDKGVDAVVPALTNLFSNLARHSFVRIVTSTDPIALPIITNVFKIINSSSGDLSNLTFGTIQNFVHTDTTNIPVLFPAHTSDWVTLAVPFVFVGTVMMGGYDAYYSDGEYIRYQQGGVTRWFEQPLMSFGPPPHEIIGIVSNTSVTLNWPWLNWAGTKQW